MSDVKDLSDDRTAEPAEVAPSDTKKSLGRLLVQMGRMSSRDVDRVLQKQMEDNCSFGEAAVALRLVTQRDIMEALARQYQYPTLQGMERRDGMSRELVVGHEPFGAAAEEFRAIRTSLLHSHVSEGLRSLAVVGVHEGAGATYFASNLALSMAQMTLPTILVESNLRSPRIAEMWNMPRRSRGLSEVLRHHDGDPSAVITEVVPNLSVLLCGAEPPNPQELLCSPEFAQLTQWLESRYRVVIYDTAPAKEFADARVVGAVVGSAIVVARRNRSRTRDTTEIVERLETVGCNVAGTIFNSH
ncbi:polysaccharide biosynthesis tyrosine autokinase [Caenispirillum bisanense]|uniref:Chain length determinant protein tyrosine kinase EpsG n=1 Tax=Caenispirillum bisanense TaxID=414052 RepID=A0A286H0E9_9PROT|nr:polysaccharide biosynthesis tyrosine autokinase [Caenispirillum bisanense]SOE00774.1 chain length determinant protein tyrosine kinase EpsG [Caenispirillum bisanense]